MQLRQVALRDRDAWESIVRTCGGNGLHMPEVHLPDHEPHDLKQLAFEVDGVSVGCALVVDRAPRLLDRVRGRERVLLLPTAPAIGIPGHAAAVRSALFDFARDAGVARTVIQPAYGDWVTPDTDLERFRTSSITEFVLDVREGYETVLSGMHKIHRKNIRRAARSELEVVKDSSLEALLQLRTLQVASSERAEARTEGFAVRDERYFRSIQTHVYGPGRGGLLLARLNGETVAALAWLTAGDRILTVRSGSLPVGYESRAMYLLHDHLFRTAIESGVKEINIGGVPAGASDPNHPQSGLYEFKKGFGGEARDRHALDIRLEEVDR